MQLYIANGTRQRHIFAYRVPEDDVEQRITAYTKTIEPGGQVVLPQSLNPLQIKSIIAQHVKYGIVAANEVGNTTDICGRCYSVDKPVSVEQIQRLVARNDQFMAVRGQRMREDAAVASHASIERTLREQAVPGNVNSLEMSVDEEDKGSRSDDLKPVAEGVQVTPFVHGRRTVPSGPGGRPITNREDMAPRAKRRRA